MHPHIYSQKCMPAHPQMHAHTSLLSILTSYTHTYTYKYIAMQSNKFLQMPHECQLTPSAMPLPHAMSLRQSCSNVCDSNECCSDGCCANRMEPTQAGQKRTENSIRHIKKPKRYNDRYIKVQDSICIEKINI